MPGDMSFLKGLFLASCYAFDSDLLVQLAFASKDQLRRQIRGTSNIFHNRSVMRFVSMCRSIAMSTIGHHTVIPHLVPQMSSLPNVMEVELQLVLACITKICVAATKEARTPGENLSPKITLCSLVTHL